jgi:hypothetical protein
MRRLGRSWRRRDKEKGLVLWVILSKAGLVLCSIYGGYAGSDITSTEADVVRANEERCGSQWQHGVMEIEWFHRLYNFIPTVSGTENYAVTKKKSCNDLAQVCQSNP